MKLIVTLLSLLVVCVGTAVGVKCYVGAGETVILMDCGSSSNKCIKTKVNDLIGKICYSQMDWSRFPTFNPTVGCQKYSAAGMTAEICICVGDKCNAGGFGKSGPATSKLPSAYKPRAKFETVTTGSTPMPTSTDVGFGIHHTSTTDLMAHKYKVKHATTPTPRSTSGTKCYVGLGENTFLQNCIGSSNKCVKSKVNGVVAKVCYSQMAWSKFPTFDPRVGCQKFSAAGTTTEICICTGSRCNAGGFDKTDSTTHLPVTTTTPKRSDRVTCEVGIGSNTYDMDCGPTSSRCVWSKVNEKVAKVCYNQMDWSLYPAFDPRLGCQEATTNGMYVKICICAADNCNQHEPSGNSMAPRRSKNSLAPTASAIRHTTSGASNAYTTSISTILLLAIAGYLLQ